MVGSLDTSNLTVKTARECMKDLDGSKPESTNDNVNLTMSNYLFPLFSSESHEEEFMEFRC